MQQKKPDADNDCLIDLEKLKQLIDEGWSQNTIARRLGTTKGKIAYAARVNNLGIFAGKWVCKHCGQSDKTKFYISRPNICKICANSTTVAYRRERKSLLIAYKGGKCEICGYNKCQGSLDFHHTNPHNKTPNWEHKKYSASLESHLEEVDKCMLVCKNCHGEIHWNLYASNQELVEIVSQ